MLRKMLLAATAVVSVAIGGVTAPIPAAAQTVYCTNCASQFTQLKQQADQALQLARQAEQLKAQLDAYARMGENLPEHLFGDVARDIANVNRVFEQAKGLAYSAANIDEQFAQRYGSLDSYRAAGVDDERLQEKYRQWNTESNDAVLQTMRALGVQSQGMASEQDLLRQLQTQARNPNNGQMEVMAIGNELAAESIAQTQKLRQLMMLQIQLQAQTMQLEADRDAVSAARAREFFGGDGAPPTYAGQTY